MSPRNKMEKAKEKIPYDLTRSERWWRDRYDFLMKHGYQLRPRFRPGWIPSWVRRKRDPLLCEDGHMTLHPKVIDAVRVSDGTKVAIKRVPRTRRNNELAILEYLTSEEMLKDPRNHTVPVLDVISEDGDSETFIIMPLLIYFHFLSFTSVEEVVDFMRQTLEGLSFLHEHNIAHRDCSLFNIMMDGTPMYPRGFHPGAPNLEYSGKHLAYPRQRRDAPGIRYYFTDFGISSRFHENDAYRLVTGKDCLDKTLPELSQNDPYDPFAVDIYLLGNVFKYAFVRGYKYLSFLAPLGDVMTQKDPTLRPTVAESLEILNKLVGEQPPRALRRIIIANNADRLNQFLCDLSTMKREAKLAIRYYLLLLLGREVNGQY